MKLGYYPHHEPLLGHRVAASGQGSLGADGLVVIRKGGALNKVNTVNHFRLREALLLKTFCVNLIELATGLNSGERAMSIFQSGLRSGI